MEVTPAMKKLILVLVLLLGAQTYGVVGAAQAQRIMYTCKLEVGPLCYQWEENGLSKMLGKDNMEKLEDKLGDAKKKWEQDFIKRHTSKNGITDMVKDGIDGAADAFKKALDGK